MKIKNSFFIFFLVCTLLINSFVIFSPTVKAVTGVIENWESYNPGSSSGSGIYFDWENASTPIGGWGAGDTSKAEIDTTPVRFPGGDEILYLIGDGNGGEAGKLYCNFTDVYDYTRSLSILFDYKELTSDANIYIRFNLDSVEVLELEITGDSSDDDINCYYYDNNNVQQHIGEFTEEGDCDYFWFNVTHIGGNIMKYTVTNNTGVSISEEDSCRIVTDWASFDQIEFYQTGVGYEFILDDISIDTDTEAPSESEIYINFLDADTGQLFQYFDWVGPVNENNINRFLWGSLTSTINGGVVYNLQNEDFPLSISGTFTNGAYHYINLSIVKGFVGEYLFYSNFTTFIQLYDGQTYTFGLQRADPLEYTYNNGDCELRTKWFSEQTLEFCLGTDKKFYAEGEDVIVFYKMPTISELFDFGEFSGGYEINIWNITDNWLFVPDNGDTAEYSYNTLVYDKQFHTFSWTPGNISGGINEFVVGIIHDDWWLPATYINVHFWVTETGFVPSGNITSVSPSNPFIGQDINITFDANNGGIIDYKHIYEPDANSKIIQPHFEKFTGSESVIFKIWEIGVYQINLRVWNGQGYVVVDSSVVTVNSTSNISGAFAYNIEFLTVEPERAIAGFDYIVLNYQTLKDGTLIRVRDSRNQTTPYGTYVDDNGTSTLQFFLPQYASIGTWNVSMNGSEYHYSEFSVIADEHNYFEMTKNTYYDNERFVIRGTHNKKVAFTFYYNDLAVGQDLIFDTTEQTNFEYIVPFDIIPLRPGSWRVEMWQVNNLVRIRELAEDTMTVITRPPGSIEEGYGDILSMLALGGEIFGGGTVGLAMMSVVLIIVIIIGLAYIKVDNGTIFLISLISTLLFVFIGWLPVTIGILAIVLTGLLFGEKITSMVNLGGK